MEYIKKILKTNWKEFKNSRTSKKDILNRGRIGKDIKKLKNAEIITEDKYEFLESILFLLKGIFNANDKYVSSNGREGFDYSKTKSLLQDLEALRFIEHQSFFAGGNFSFSLIRKDHATDYLTKLFEDELDFLDTKNKKMKKFSWLFRDIKNLIIGILITVIAGLILYILIGGHQ